MPTTPIYALRYPATTDPADVPTDMGELATDIEAALSTKAHGVELAYAEFAASVTVTGTTDAASQLLVSAGPVSFDGTPVIVEFFAATVTVNANAVQLKLFDATGGDPGTNLGVIAEAYIAAVGQVNMPIGVVCRRFTPAAGTRTYKIRATINTGSGQVSAGAPYVPGFVRIVKV